MSKEVNLNFKETTKEYDSKINAGEIYDILNLKNNRYLNWML
jgi:hypothetical protein